MWSEKVPSFSPLCLGLFWRVLYVGKDNVSLRSFLPFFSLERFHTECSLCDVGKAGLFEEMYDASCSKYSASLISMLLRPIKSATLLLYMCSFPIPTASAAACQEHFKAAYDSWD